MSRRRRARCEGRARMSRPAGAPRSRRRRTSTGCRDRSAGAGRAARTPGAFQQRSLVDRDEGLPLSDRSLCSNAVCRGLSRTGYPSSCRDRGRLARIGAGQARRWRQAGRGGVVEHRQLVDGPVHRVLARQPMAHPVVEDVTVVGDRQHRGVAPGRTAAKSPAEACLRHFGGEAAGVLTRIADPEAGTDPARPLPGAGGSLVAAPTRKPSRARHSQVPTVERACASVSRTPGFIAAG